MTRATDSAGERSPGFGEVTVFRTRRWNIARWARRVRRRRAQDRVDRGARSPEIQKRLTTNLLQSAQTGTSWRTISASVVGVVIGIALGFAGAFGGLTALLIVLVTSVLGLLAGSIVDGRLSIGGLAGGRSGREGR